jgi:hypothetical protein
METLMANYIQWDEAQELIWKQEVEEGNYREYQEYKKLNCLII